MVAVADYEDFTYTRSQHSHKTLTQPLTTFTCAQHTRTALKHKDNTHTHTYAQYSRTTDRTATQDQHLLYRLHTLLTHAYHSHTSFTLTLTHTSSYMRSTLMHHTTVTHITGLMFILIQNLVGLVCVSVKLLIFESSSRAV